MAHLLRISHCFRKFPLVKLSCCYCSQSRFISFVKNPVVRKPVLQKWIHPLQNSFHTSPKLNLHPVLIIFAKQAGKLVAILTGRGFRKWWRSLPDNKKEYFYSSVKKNYVYILTTLALATGLGIVYYEMHVQETPITKRKRFIAFTPEQFEKISQFEFEMQYESHKNQMLPQNHPLCNRVSNVATRLLQGNKDVSQIYTKTWSVSVVEDPAQNAFVLPNGHIFVFTGMLKICSNDDQLGIVLAHEMAHCILGHGPEQISYSHLIDMMIIVALAGIWAVLPSDGIALVTQWFFNKVVEILLHLPYSRKLETEADEVGLELAAKSCFDVRESSAFWKKMSLLGDMEGEVSVEFLSTHPTHENRSENLDNIMNRAIELREKCGCPKLSSYDPRALIAALKKEAEMVTKKDIPVVILPLPKR